MKNLSKKEFYNQLQWLQNSVILPNGHRVSKIEFVTSNGFDFDGMYDLLDRYYDKWFKDPSMVEGSRM